MNDVCPRWLAGHSSGGSMAEAPTDAVGTVGGEGGECRPGVTNHTQMPPAVLSTASGDHGPPTDATGDVGGRGTSGNRP